MFTPSPALAEGVARATGRRPVAWNERLASGGFTPAHRLIVRFADDGPSAFVKAATSENTVRWIRQEIAVYERLSGSCFLPHYFGGERGSDAEPESTFLVLEDLSVCHWPPPWNPGQVNAVLKALDAVHAGAARFPPGELPPPPTRSPPAVTGRMSPPTPRPSWP